MSMLSDEAIRSLMASGSLVLRGEESRVGACSYQFAPGKVLITGRRQADDPIPAETYPIARNWSAETPEESYDVEPGDMVWIRTREIASIPDDICAFWWQTNTLSRKGLMLVNMSMVEPGYRGHLACLFANFGEDPVRLRPSTRIAKLGFWRLDATSKQPVPPLPDTVQYDEELVDAATSAPRSFLQVGELASTLARERKEARDELVRTRMDQVDQATKEIDAQRAEAKTGLEGDLKGSFWKAVWPFALALGALIVVLNFVPSARSLLQPVDDAAVRGIIQEELDDEASADLSAQVAEIEERLEEMEKRIDD